ncbi:hypothetical protein OA848_00780 [Rickettsiales bacterium]|nr:hypothetical protein [Rickettsiales bacterium]
MKDFKKIHSLLIKKASPFPFLKDLIIVNGIIIQKKTNLDLLSFVCKTIISQQISNKAAISIWKNVIKIGKLENLSLSELLKKNKLSDIGISRQKLSYIKEFDLAISQKKINEVKMSTLNSQNLKKKLLSYRGIGAWTLDMIEIFYLTNYNIWPEKDFVIKKMIKIINEKEKVSINYKKIFSPYLSILALHLWKVCD